MSVGDPKYQYTMNNGRVPYDVVKRSDWAKPTPDVCGTKSAFCDKTFPGRKQQAIPSSGCKIGDFYRLSRHSYSDLDRCDNGEELVKSTTATNLRVHFASESNGPPPNDKSFTSLAGIQNGGVSAMNYGYSNGAANRPAQTFWVVNTSNGYAI